MNEESRTYGYARVSSKAQNESRQMDALLEYGISKRDIYVDKASGKDFLRPKYETLKSLAQPGDTIVLLDIDRLGRNYEEMANEWREITREKECDIVVLNYPILSTKDKEGSLDKRFIADMIFGLLCYVAERERISIRERQREGIDSAMNRGVQFGRPKVPMPNEFPMVFQRVLDREITNRKAMELLDLKPNTYYGFVKELKVKG